MGDKSVSKLFVFIIYSSDRDLAQLVSVDTDLYNPAHGKIYKPGDNIEYDHETILIENVKLVKMMCGDSSDNIAGIRGMGVKRFLSLFPELRTEQISIEQVKDKCNVLFEQDKTNRLVTNLLTGVTKHGVFGDEFFDVNSRIVSLDDPFLTDEAKQNIDSLINENLDPDGRSYKNTMKMMMEDGLFNVLPKSDDAWIRFLNPFLRLTRKEKNKRIQFFYDHFLNYVYPEDLFYNKKFEVLTTDKLDFEYPTLEKAIEISKLEKDFLKEQDLLIMSIDSWKKLIDTRSVWLNNTPSLLIIKP